MSGIFGFFNRNGELASHHTLSAMQKQMQSYRVDSSKIYIENMTGFGHAMVWNTPESYRENLPVSVQIGGKSLVLTADVRLDNHKELTQLLGLDPLAVWTEGDLIFRAYLKWGEEAPRHLLGDYAFAIYDPLKNEIFCATDHSGIKPLYYHLSDERFVFSNDMRTLTVHPDVPRGYNDKAVALFLTQRTFAHPSWTLFEAIEKLPPASTLTITPSSVRRKVYWDARECPDIRFGKIDDYSQMLRELLETAVIDRTRSLYPIATHLSGGLDSSAIAVIANRHLSKENRPLKAYNWIHPPEPGEDPDHPEWRNSRIVSEAEGIENHYFRLDMQQLKEVLWSDDLANNELTMTLYEKPFLDIAHKDGVRTILSGWGGDELISYSGIDLQRCLFRRGHFFTLIKNLCGQTHSIRGVAGGTAGQVGTQRTAPSGSHSR